MARAALQLSGRQLAEQADLHPNTIIAAERGGNVSKGTMAVLQKAFEAAGIEFLPENGVRLRKED